MSIARFRAPIAGEIGTGTLRNVPIFRAGVWNGKKYSVSSLQAMVAAFPEVGFTPPLTLGHTDDPSALAHGRVTALRLSGDTLFADFEGVPAETIALIRAGRLLTLSAEIYFGLERNGREFPFALRRVALLGGHPPGVSDLPPLREALS